VDVEWRPFYLRPDTPPEGMELPDYIKRSRANGSEERLKQIADTYGMVFVSTKRIYNTRIVHEATEFAREHGKGNEFHRVIFRKVYAEGADPSQWDVLRAAWQGGSPCSVLVSLPWLQTHAGLHGASHHRAFLSGMCWSWLPWS
jgi:predicted DsbA family dithiol-disulfide isomerase